MTAVFVTMPFPGVRRIGEEGAKLGLWDLVVLEGARAAIPPAEVYVLGAWHTQYIPVLSALGTRPRVGVCWTSSAAEMELNAPVEFEYLAAILKDPRFAFVWFGDPGLAQAFPEKGFDYPYPLHFDPQPAQPKQEILTLFCPDKPSKNIFAQLLAVAIVQREQPELVLHTNVPDLRGLEQRLNVVRHGWLPRPEYHQLLASARLNLAVSFAETMCYQAAEAVLLRTPCLLSRAIPWAPTSHLTFGPSSCDPNELAEDISLALEGQEERPLADLEAQLRYLEHYAARFSPQEWEQQCLDAPAAKLL